MIATTASKEPQGPFFFLSFFFLNPFDTDTNGTGLARLQILDPINQVFGLFKNNDYF